MFPEAFPEFDANAVNPLFNKEPNAELLVISLIWDSGEELNAHFVHCVRAYGCCVTCVHY